MALWLVIGIVMIALYNMFSQPLNTQSEVVFSDFMDQVESGRVTSVKLDGETIDVLLEDGEQYRVVRPIGNDVVTPLRDNGVKIQVPPFIENGDEIIVDTRTIEYVKKI